jgi:DNA-binding NarL/FixJ family response regulator
VRSALRSENPLADVLADRVALAPDRLTEREVEVLRLMTG